MILGAFSVHRTYRIYLIATKLCLKPPTPSETVYQGSQTIYIRVALRTFFAPDQAQDAPQTNPQGFRGYVAPIMAPVAKGESLRLSGKTTDLLRRSNHESD